MIKITFDKDNLICECGHIRHEHNSWGSACYRIINRKERRRNPNTNKYEVRQTHYQCTCKEFKEVKDETNEKN